MTSASWALQQAVFAMLAVSADVKALVGDRLFDAVPRGSPFPYVVVGEAEEKPFATATESGSEHTLSVRIWSRGSGHREVKKIAGVVRQVLDGAALSLTGHTLVDLRFVSAEYARQSDGETYRAVIRFRALTEPE